MTWEIGLAVWLVGALGVFAYNVVNGIGKTWRRYQDEFSFGVAVFAIVVVTLVAALACLWLWPLEIAGQVYMRRKKGREA